MTPRTTGTDGERARERDRRFHRAEFLDLRDPRHLSVAVADRDGGGGSFAGTAGRRSGSTMVTPVRISAPSMQRPMADGDAGDIGDRIARSHGQKARQNRGGKRGGGKHRFRKGLTRGGRVSRDGKRGVSSISPGDSREIPLNRMGSGGSREPRTPQAHTDVMS